MIASHADIIVARVAFQAMVTSIGGRDRVATDVAECCEVQRSEDEVCDGAVARGSTERSRLGRPWRCASSTANWRCCERQAGCKRVPGRRVSCFIGNWQQRMGAVPSLVHAVIAKAPISLIAKVTLPVTGICKSFTCVTENAFFEPLLRVVVAHKLMRRGWRFGQQRQWCSVATSGQNMRQFILGGIPPFWAVTLELGHGQPAKAEPVLASFASTIAAMANIIVSIVAF